MTMLKQKSAARGTAMMPLRDVYWLRKKLRTETARLLKQMTVEKKMFEVQKKVDGLAAELTAWSSRSTSCKS